MSLVAALSSGVFVLFLVGLMAGTAPQPRVRRRARPEVSAQQTWLIQAGVDLTPRQFWLTSVIAGLVAFGVFLLITGIPVIAVVPAALVGLLPRVYFARRRLQRLSEVQESWPDGLRDLIASISSGMSLPRAIETLTTSGPSPLREAFGRFPLLARTIGVVEALEIIKEELSDPTSDRVIEVLILAHERGGAIVTEILQDLTEATTRDLWALEELRTLSLEQKINARAVFILPWLVLVALTARQGAFRDYYATGRGTVVVIIAALMSLFGIWLVARLGRDPVEERVMGGASRLGETSA